MSLWIRSQDKEQLLQVERLFLRDKMICTNIREVLGWTLLGEYQTKERAIEILNEIQKKLQPMYKVTSEFKKSELTGKYNWVENSEYMPFQSQVYEMPEI